jgi:hypothetical protein
VYVEDRKKLEVKSDFLNFFVEAKKLHSTKKLFAESQPVGFRQRNLCRVFFSLPRVFLVRSRQISLFAECFSLLGAFYLALDKTFFAESFSFGSWQRPEL